MKQQRGATAIEYALLISALGLAAILGAQLLEQPMTDRYNATCGDMANSATVAGESGACLADGVDFVPDPTPSVAPSVSPTPPPDEVDPDPVTGQCPPGYKKNAKGNKCVKDNKPGG